MTLTANDFNVIKGQGTEIEVERLGSGTFEDPFRPNTTQIPWIFVSETTNNTYVIESFESQLDAFVGASQVESISRGSLSKFGRDIFLKEDEQSEMSLKDIGEYIDARTIEAPVISKVVEEEDIDIEAQVREAIYEMQMLQEKLGLKETTTEHEDDLEIEAEQVPVFVDRNWFVMAWQWLKQFIVKIFAKIMFWKER